MLADYLCTECPELDMVRISRHFVRAEDPEKFASTLINFMGRCYPGEDDVAIARAVLMLQRDALPLFNMLRVRYKSCIDREPLLNELLDEIAQRFYGVQRKNPMEGMFGDIFKSVQPPPPKMATPVTSPRIKLRDGRHLAYKELGAPREEAKPRLGRTKVLCPRIFNGKSNHLVLSSLHSLAGAALIASVVNYWWRNLPANLSKEALSLMLSRDQWMLRVAHYTHLGLLSGGTPRDCSHSSGSLYTPWLTFWWNTQRLFSLGSYFSCGSNILSFQDKEIFSKLGYNDLNQVYARQQGEYEKSLHRDLMIGYGHWEFDPLDVQNPFKNSNGSVHLCASVASAFYHLKTSK
ncbi:hypothetical protein F2Q68_00004091 [Brassica cretica]|uniref:Uncharacterized protein n=1 Tax=Brassica cretica TaxID=69181 RepID=A0A8S9JC18_BRACR|nr:hypothetical protein F2Q68_00004091 [Brassica cretica]